jgi:hypothetical protein
VNDKTKENDGEVAGRNLKWDDDGMTSAYANVCNVAGTREEITLLFGTHQNWHAGQKDVTVKLSHRIVVNPYAAKRLALLLNAALKKYEASFGPVVLEPSQSDPTH